MTDAATSPNVVLPASALAESGVAPRPSPRRAYVLTPAQIKLIRATVARACSDDEFDHFIAVAERTGLDPLRRQIHALITNPNDPQRRVMTPQAGIDGLRAIAARHGDYRPMEDASDILFDANHRDEARNPLGIVRAKVTVWKMFDRAWFPIVGEAWWDEFAPGASAEELALAGASRSNAQANSRGAIALAANWRKMGRVLIAKCAEAQALRRGWPEDLSGLYGEEELHRAAFDDAFASLRLATYEAEERHKRLSAGNAFLFTFEAGRPPELVPLNEIVDRAREALIAASSEQLAYFEDTNRDATRLLWERDAATAFALRQLVEGAQARCVADPRSVSSPGAVAAQLGAAPITHGLEVRETAFSLSTAQTRRRQPKHAPSEGTTHVKPTQQVRSVEEADATQAAQSAQGGAEAPDVSATGGDQTDGGSAPQPHVANEGSQAPSLKGRRAGAKAKAPAKRAAATRGQKKAISRPQARHS